MAVNQSDITPPIVDAWRNYQKNPNDPTSKGTWWEVCGGAVKAKEFEKFLSRKTPPPPPTAKAAKTKTKPAQADPSRTKPKGRPQNRLTGEERDGFDIDAGKDSWNQMPPILGLMITFVIAFAMYLDGQFTNLGIILLSFSLGFHFVSLVWLEILTMPRFRRRSDMDWVYSVWSIIVGVSMAASTVIILTNLTPTLDTFEFGMIFNDHADRSPVLEICLILQIALNILAVMSMQGQERVSIRALRSPWTVGSIASLVTLCVLLVYPDYQWSDDLILMVFATIIIGSSAWIYGRSEDVSAIEVLVYTLIPSTLGFIILDQADLQILDEGTNSSLILISFIALPIVLNTITWTFPRRSSDYSAEEMNQDKMSVIWTSLVIFGITVTGALLIGLQSDSIVLPLLPLIFAYHMYSREHSKKMGGDILRVHRILPRESTGNKGYKKVGLKFSILGASGTGKTSFTTALWTLLTTSQNSNIWWAKAIDSENEHQILLQDQDTLNQLASRGGCDTAEGMIASRICMTTCREWIEQRIFPQPQASPFPFQAEAFGQSQRELQELRALMVDTNPDKRGLPEPTTEPGKVEMTVSFHADVSVISPSFMFTKSPFNRSNSGQRTEIDLTVETWDIKGESFAAAVNFTRELVNDPKLRKSQWKTIEPTNDIIENLGHALSTDPRQVSQARELFLESSHTFLIVDLEDLLGDDDQKDVQKYLRLLQKLNRGENSNLESLTVILNKADHLLDESSLVPLNDWADMNNDTKAETVLNMATNYALDDLRGTGLDVRVKFVCAFGGLVTQLDENGKPMKEYNEESKEEEEIMLAPYPMIPVNVIEPLIEVILTSRLHSEDI